MARYLLIALIAALVCFMQAYSAPAEATTPDPVQDVLKNAQENLSKLFNTENLGKTFNDNMQSLNENLNKAFAESKPTFDELMAKGQEFFASFPSMIPKTDEATPKPSA